MIISQYRDSNVSTLSIECVNSEDETSGEEDKHLNANKKVKDFKETLMIPHGKDIDDSLFYAICYTIRFEKNKTKQKR